MEIISPNRVKVPVEEQLFELITLIKPTHDNEGCSFLEGPLWKIEFFRNIIEVIHGGIAIAGQF